MIPKLYTAKELAEAWNVSEEWCYVNVPSLKIGGLRRFPEDMILAYVDQHREGARLAEVRELRGVSG